MKYINSKNFVVKTEFWTPPLYLKGGFSMEAEELAHLDFQCGSRNLKSDWLK